MHIRKGTWVLPTLPIICSSVNIQNTENISGFLEKWLWLPITTENRTEPRGKVGVFVGYADDHTGDVYRFIYLKTQNVILSRDARWMNIMWKAYMRKQKCINHELQIIDEDYESDDEEEIRENWVHQQPEDEISPLDQQRRLGLDIDMIGAREENFGSTRSQTLEMRSPSNQAMERTNINMKR